MHFSLLNHGHWFRPDNLEFERFLFFIYLFTFLVCVCGGGGGGALCPKQSTRQPPKHAVLILLL